MGKPKILVLQGDRNFAVPTYVESETVEERFEVEKSVELRGSPDLVYTQAYGPFHDEIMGCRVPVVVHVGGCPWLELNGDRLKRAVEIMRKATVVVCNSRFLLSRFRSHMPGAENLTVLPDGLWGLDHTPIGPMPSRFTPKTNYRVEGRPLVVMSLNLLNNRVTANKWGGLSLFFDALAGIKRIREKYTFVCAGRGDDKFPLLRKWTRQVDFRFERSHHLDDEEDYWPMLLEKADLFVHPSTFDCWPRSVGDAMCAASPGIVFDVTGNTEVSDAYIKVDPFDAAHMAESFESLVADPVLRRRIGSEARREALVKTEKHRRDYVDLLLRVVEEGA
jgi:glycosyltransferase involved in cell wall biosynthesis